jgi:peptide/nickel transport system substrate-binding protein
MSARYEQLPKTGRKRPCGSAGDRGLLTSKGLWLGGALLGAALLVVVCKAERPAPQKPGELKRLAEQAPPAVATLYRQLAIPQDRGERLYEETALEQIETFLREATVPALPRLRAAETALMAVLHFHGERAAKEGRYQELGQRLQSKLLAVRLQELQALLEEARQQGAWNQVLARSDWLQAHYAAHPAVRQAVAAVWEDYGRECFRAGDYRQARASYEKWEQLGVGGRGLSPLAQLLAQRAQSLLTDARQQTDAASALNLLQEALQLWPCLEGLRDEWCRRKGTYQVLYVGVRQLPEWLSPATALSDSERLALDLLFERLVRLVSDPRQGEYARPELAQSLPEVLPLGRRCRLRPDARWSTGQRLTASDVRHTVHLLRTTPGLLESAVWRDLLEPPTVGSDLLQLDISLRQGVWEPLRFLSFPVLPETLVRAEDPAFAHKPVGSGPYVYAGQQYLHQRTEVVFRANPYYRPTTGQPTIREVRFFRWEGRPEAVLQAGQPWHLLLDVPAESLAPLAQAGAGELRTLTPRRIFFLALNHRVAELQQLPLRRGLALGVDRQAILNTCFRGAPAAPAPASAPGQRTGHRALNGPFPPHSWACAPPARVPEQLYDPEQAVALLQQLPAKPIHLTLKYPADDPRVAAACRLLAQQWQELGQRAQRPLHIEVLGLPARQLHEALHRRDYQLAYCQLDYPSEVFWLWPLFDPHPQALAPGGTNYLQYAHDSPLLSLFHAAQRHRDFARLRELMQDIHVRLFDQMPFIPLWQLDYHLAVHPDLLLPAHLDPLQLFADITQWRLKTP